MSASGSVTPATDLLAQARQVADAVLYEGYVLFPYRASALKNRYRWQWGVVIPQAQVDLGATEPAVLSCETMIRATAGTRIDVTARLLHLRLRQLVDAAGAPVDELEVDGSPIPTWEEGLEHEVAATVELPADGGDGINAVARITLDAGEETEQFGAAGTAVRTTWQVTGALEVAVAAAGDGLWLVRTTVRNDTPWSQRRAPRDDVVRHSLVGVHAVLHAHDGAFASVIDPPGWADEVDLRQRGLHPVLVGDGEFAEPGSTKHVQDRLRRTEGRVVLAAPIILYDHPQIAPESPGPSFDATEVDELLALAVMGLSDEEKRRARATDPRAAALIDRTDTLPSAVQERLHGAIRGWGPASMAPEPAAGVTEEVRDLLGVGEEPLHAVAVADATVEVGDKVRLRPRRRADAHDLFVDGRVALVERIVRTVEGETYLAVTVDDDPAAELHSWYGRFAYFGVDEVEPLFDTATPTTTAPAPDTGTGPATQVGG